MSTGGTAETERLRLWLEQMIAAWQGQAGAWTEAQEIYRAWSRYLDAWAGADAARRRGASPFDPAGWLCPEGAGGMADLLRWMEGPGLAPPFHGMREGLAGWREWIVYSVAAEEMKAVVGQGWIAALRDFADELAQASEEAPQSLKDIETRWNAHTAGAIAALYRSEDFLTAQADLIRAETALRLRLQREAAAASELLGMPSRREIDDLHASVQALRRELRAARRAGSGPAASPSAEQTATDRSGDENRPDGKGGHNPDPDSEPRESGA